jgi:hypothetical protein
MSEFNVAYLAGLGFGDDPRRVALVKLLTDKTKQGKIRWAKQRSAITASLPGFEVNFVTQPSLIGSETWQLFTVRDTQGNELLRTSPAPLPFLLPSSPLPTIPVLSGELTVEQAVGELFAAVNRSAGDDLDRAISTIKNL